MLFNSLLRRSLCAFLVFSSLLKSASATQVLSGHVPAATARLTPIGHAAAKQRLNLAIGLPLRNRDALTEFVRELYEPSSPNYHQFLTPEQFTQNFGPSEEDYAAVLEFARTNGFTITATSANRVLVDVSATVEDIERALHISLSVYQHPTEQRTFFAPDREPSLELSVPIATISGLDNFVLPHPHSHLKPLSELSSPVPNAGSGPSGLYMGNDFRAAYAPGVTLNGSGQTVGLLQFDGYYAADITAYESAAGLPNVPLQNVLLDTFNGNPGGNNTEVALDIEMVASMAPGVSLIMVYEAGPNGFPNDILNQMATDNRAKQISSSWTWGGGTNSTTDGIYLQFAAQGQTYFNASGDDDAYTNNIAANYAPADDAYITVVGGTMLSTTGGGGSYISETAWNRYNGIGSGGGISSTYFLPSWQSGISMGANLGSTSMRNIPDVALTAENVYLIANNGKAYSVGGTSCASPLWAGFTALINQQAAGNGKPLVGFLNPAIYSIGKGANYNSTLHDITTGNNTNAASAGNFPAVTGYDLATGWGSPVGQPLINALAPANNVPVLSAAGSTLLLESCSPTNGAIDPGETVTMSFTLQNTGNANTTNLVATLLTTNGVAAPSAPQNFGAIPGSGGTSSRTFTFTANGTCGGTVTPTLQLQDGAVNLGSVNFPQSLGVLAAQNQSQNFDSVTAPALPAGWSSMVVTGSQTSWVTTTASSDTPPNAAFIADSTSSGENALVSPPIAIVSASAQLSFRQNYGFDVRANGSNIHYHDGGVLEIQIGSGGFVDILSAGGSFVSGGYPVTISSSTGNPLNGRAGWGGSSSGWVTATVNLPASAAGQTIQLRWACGTDSGNSSSVTGWYVDSITIQDSAYVCCTGGANVAPSFTLQPTNRTVVQGSQASFQSAANGTPAPSFQWWFNATNLLVGQTSASLVLNNVQASQAGAYSVVASNVAGAVTSAVANLTVYVSPAFTLQPTNTNVVQGGTANFQSAASGNPAPQFQWYFNVTNRLSGQTSSTLTLNNVQPSQAGAYSVVVSNIAGVVTSAVANLTVYVSPAFTLQPTNTSVVQGGTANFQSAASGNPAPQFQWYLNLTNRLSGQTSSTLTLNNVQPSQAGAYSVIVSNVAGAVTSAVANLTVYVAPSFTLQPTNTTVVQNGTATFQSAASGSPAPEFQWYFNATNLLSGQTSSSLALNNVQPSQAGAYSVVVSNVAGAVTSAVANLTVYVVPLFTLQPTNTTVVRNGTATFQSAASGSPAPEFQWYFNITNVLSGETSSTLTLSNVQSSQAGGYSVVVSNLAGMATSSVANLTVHAPPSFTLQPTNTAVMEGGTATFQSAASGNPTPQFQWYFNATNLMNGETSSTLSLSNVQSSQAGAYSVLVSNVAGSATSVVAQLTVLVPPNVASQPTNTTVVQGGSANFQVTATGTPVLSYQWFFNATNLLAGQTASMLTVANAQASQMGSYQVVITNSAGSITSAAAQLRVLVSPVITLTSFDVSGPTVSVSLPSLSGLNYTLEYKDSLTDSNWTALPITVSGTGDVIILQDTNAVPANRFYRVNCN